MALSLDFQLIQARSQTEQDINLHIARRLRRRRRLIGMTQRDLGDQLGLKFQQIQKYECADNRIFASRLHRLATALQAPVQYFFDGLPDALNGPANDHGGLDSVLYNNDTLDLVEAYLKLPASVRHKLREFAKALSEERA